MAAVENRFGKGRTLLIGSFPGAGYYLHHLPEARRFFAGLLEWAKVEPRLRMDARGIEARLHTGEGGTWLWIVNPDRAPGAATVTLADRYEGGADAWGGSKVTVAGREVRVEVGDRDVAVIRLR